MMHDLQACLDLVYRSYLRVGGQLHGTDAQTRHPAVSRQLFARLSLPLDRLPVLLVTGSKGKGSTALLAAAMLQGMGYRVGLLTSPHLVDFRERIRVDGQAISVADYVRVMNAHADAILRLDEELPAGQYIGPNGIVFACGLHFFLEQGVEVLVVEAGRGGRFDEASLFAATALCLTPMMGEHLDTLGPAVADVAWHKAGLIAPGCTVAVAPQPPEAAAVIAKIAGEQHARLLWAGAEISYRMAMDAQLLVEVEVAVLGVREQFTLRTQGHYQGLNTALAAAGAAALAQADGRTLAGMGRLVGRLRLPGRCEPIADGPLVVVDGAINRASAEQFLAGAHARRSAPTVLVTALPSDKDHRGLLETLAPHVAQIIITEADNPHLHFDTAAAEAARTLHPAVEQIRPATAAFERGVTLAGPGGTLWVVGTQSLVRDALRHWNQTLETIWVAA